VEEDRAQPGTGTESQQIPSPAGEAGRFGSTADGRPAATGATQHPSCDRGQRSWML